VEFRPLFFRELATTTTQSNRLVISDVVSIYFTLNYLFNIVLRSDAYYDAICASSIGRIVTNFCFLEYPNAERFDASCPNHFDSERTRYST
jgi:hypothetical protein